MCHRKKFSLLVENENFCNYPPFEFMKSKKGFELSPKTFLDEQLSLYTILFILL